MFLTEDNGVLRTSAVLNNNKYQGSGTNTFYPIHARYLYGNTFTVTYRNDADLLKTQPANLE